MRVLAIAVTGVLVAIAAAPALAGPGCAGYKAAKVTYPATALEPAAPQTPVPSTGGGG